MLRSILTTNFVPSRQAGFVKVEMAVRALWLGLFVVLGVGCSSAPSQPAAPPTVDVTGGWVGTWDRGAGYNGNVTLHLQQTGSKVVGDLGMSPSVPGEIGAVEGTVVGNELSFRRIGVAYGADVTVNGDEMSGWSTGGARYRLQRQK